MGFLTGLTLYRTYRRQRVSWVRGFGRSRGSGKAEDQTEEPLV